jgi:hypothetical protein
MPRIAQCSLEVADLLLLLVDPAREAHRQKPPGVEGQTHQSPLLKPRGENSSIEGPSATVNRKRSAQTVAWIWCWENANQPKQASAARS